MEYAVELTEAERRLLREGLSQWGGPAAGTNEIATGLGFADLRDLVFGSGCSLERRIEVGEPLSSEDWERAMRAIEVVFASAYWGAASDWEIVTGMTDHETIDLLRSVQRKLRVVPRSATRREALEQSRKSVMG
jgi:hypothetical protein